MNNRPIGVYDSGFGGLSVWRELHRALPCESLIYLGDGKNCPYGSLPKQRITELAEAAVRDLVERGCKMVVVACNTATAAAISHLRATFDIPIVGLEPAVKPACAMTRSKVVGVIATERSLKGEKFLSTVPAYRFLKRQVTWSAGHVVWYFHLSQNFPQFVVIHTVKGFSIINEAE